MKVHMDENCLWLESEDTYDAFTVGQIYQVTKAAGMDCTCGSNKVHRPYVVLGLTPAPKNENSP